MFEFIRKIFRKEKKESVEFDKLGAWLDSKITQKEAENAKITEEFHNNMKKSLKQLESLKEDLNNAKYKKPIEPKIENIVNQNRLIFLKQLERLNTEDLDINSVEKKLQNVISANMKVIGTLKHLYFEETDAVMKNLKYMAESVHRLKDQTESINASKYIAAKEKYLLYYEDFKKKDVLKNRVAELKLIIDKEKEHIVTKKEQLNSLSTSSELAEYEMLVKDVSSFKLAISDLESNMKSVFSVLEYAFKKYSRLALNQIIIMEYVNDPINTLLDDKQLKVIDILKSIKIKIDRLDLKDKKREKTLEIIESFSAEKVYKFKKEYEENNIKLEQVEAELKNNGYLKSKDNILREINDIEIRVKLLSKEHEDTIKFENNFEIDKDIIDEVEIC